MSTRLEIQEIRRKFTEFGYPTFTVIYEKPTRQVFTCFVLPQALEPELLRFAMQMVATDKEGEDPDSNSVFGVADTIPEEFREWVVLHEIFEYWLCMSCPDALQKEIFTTRDSVFSEEQNRAYFAMRKIFFADLVPYATKKGYPPEKIMQFQCTRNWLFLGKF